MSDGTPLRRFGQFRVYQTKRRQPFYEVRDEATGDGVLWSYVRESANHGADRLARGEPLESPRERRDRSIALHAIIFPTQFRYAWSVYLHHRPWINGGVADREVDTLTPVGIAWQLAKDAKDVAAGACAEEAAAIRAAYAAGTWPTHATLENMDSHARAVREGRPWPLNTVLSVDDDCTLAQFAFGAPANAEWLEDARQACALLVAHGVDDPELGVGAMERVREWARRLTGRHGGAWGV